MHHIQQEHEHSKDDATPDIEIFGQRINYPRTWQGVTVVLVIAILVIIITYIVLVQSRPENLRSLGLVTGQLQIDSQQKNVEQRKWFRFEFWTPSEKTAIGLQNFLDRHPEQTNNYKWQIHNKKTNDLIEKNLSFGNRLMRDSTIDGYRRHPVIGDGSSGVKEGWWWVVGVEGEYSDNFFKWFAQTYKEHWGMPDDANSHVEITALSADKPTSKP